VHGRVLAMAPSLCVDYGKAGVPRNGERGVAVGCSVKTLRTGWYAQRMCRAT